MLHFSNKNAQNSCLVVEPQNFGQAPVNLGVLLYLIANVNFAELLEEAEHCQLEFLAAALR